MVAFLEQFSPVIQALFATFFTWGVTALGAAGVFLSKEISRKLLDGMLGFAAGVMIAASYWSLLAPSIEISESLGVPSYLPPAIGFMAGGIVLWAIDRTLPHLHLNMPTASAEGVKTTWQRSILLVLAITMHNLPEGMAVGVAFGAAAAGISGASLPGAIALAIGIGIQNFPEGLAISAPLRREGFSRFRSFWYGQLSAVVEPIGAVIGAAAVITMRQILPYALAFAAGAMIFVVIEELIPEAEQGQNTDIATAGAMLGFTVMMILDVALGRTLFMKKISKLSKSAFLIAVSFGINKVMAILRQLIIARQFGLTAELDVFNVANNIPDLLYALISGGALAVAIIPVMTEVMTRENRETAWRVFSQVANLAFLATALLSAFAAIFAWPLVQHALGIAPGLDLTQQTLVVELLRLNLIGTLIFSMAGLLIAGLQANKHFLLPAIGPILYNVGQIYGAIILSPKVGYQVGPFTLPAAGLGVHGLVYGVLIGSLLYFLIQIPGLVKYQFKWTPRINFADADVRKILAMLGPRVIGMLLYQLTFIARDNMASRLPLGSISALTYGWMILQVPETLIGTAIGTALLPTISELIARKEFKEFKDTVNRVVRVLIALAIPSAVLLSLSLPPLLGFAFGFDSAGTDLLLWVTRAFLVGLLGHCLLELGSRVFFAQQNSVIPMAAAGINLVVYILSGIILSAQFKAVGIGLADAIGFTTQALFLLLVFKIRLNKKPAVVMDTSDAVSMKQNNAEILNTVLRTVAGSIIGGMVIILTIRFSTGVMPELLIGILAAALGIAAALPFIFKEIRVLLHL